MDSTKPCDGSEKESKLKKLKAYEVSVRHRVSCEEKAFKIVNKLIDGAFSGDYLIECSKLISRDHYDDIVEERALDHQCGYPICGNPLGKIPKQKYFISTRSNKVFDITERKNFCSNRCFQASNHFKEQISEAPVWGRGHEPYEEVTLLSGVNNRGTVGKEVIIMDPKKALEEEVAALESLPETKTNPNNKSRTVLASKKQINCDSSEDQSKSISPISNCLVTEKVEDDMTEATLKFLTSDNSGVESLSESLEKWSLDCKNPNASLNETNGGKFATNYVNEKHKLSAVDMGNKLSHLDGNKHNTEMCDNFKNNPQISKQSGHDVYNKRNLNDSENLSDNKLQQLKKLMAKNKRVLSNMIEVETVRVEPHELPSQQAEIIIAQPETTKMEHIEESHHKETVQRKKTKKPKEQPSPFAKITGTLKRWITLQTVDYLKSWQTPDPGNTVTFNDPKVRMGYAQLCRSLDRSEKEMEDFVDQVVGGQEDSSNLDASPTHPKPIAPPAGHLPDYEKLREETEAFTVKVKEYYTGRKTPQVKERLKNVDTGDIYIPPVDSYNQQEIRAKIVLERLDKCLGEILTALGLTVQEISDYLRELCHTFNFEKDTIVFKPWEWTIVTMFVILILSKKLPLVAKCFKRDSAVIFFDTVLGGIGLTLADLDQQVTDLLTLPATFEVKADGSIGMSR